MVTPSAASIDRVKLVRCAPSVSLTMSGKPQLPAALPREREADEPAPVARHEIHVLGPHAVGRHDEVALVLAILIVHDHRHLAAAQIVENLVDAVHRSP